ncbi:hypothetical protein PVK06_026707 [Gossypium arboreum]|uniref:Uncharacterized protein n=1 Tax=Gossypium arboreum TaxID=29729 RepID=A0ABR0NYE1_GOSAR|nr:hypothetical protein PVK06_026707 [Gossypium arboreum]
MMSPLSTILGLEKKKKKEEEEKKKKKKKKKNYWVQEMGEYIAVLLEFGGIKTVPSSHSQPQRLQLPQEILERLWAAQPVEELSPLQVRKAGKKFDAESRLW